MYILEREIREEVKSNIGKVHLLYAVVRAPRPHTRRSTSAQCWFFHYFDKCLGLSVKIFVTVVGLLRIVTLKPP